MYNSSSKVLVILGSTGTGKSKLAIELAKKFNGEIISADSMQIYKGLDIVTNKVSSEEQEEAIHHMIDFIDPLSRYTVVDFQNHALPIIENIVQQKKLPIIVGGTNYYIESLLWDVLIKAQAPKGKLLFDSDSDDEHDKFSSESKMSKSSVESIDVKELLEQKITQGSLKNVPSNLLHQALHQIDPAMADTLHPQDRRKVIRSLQVYQQHGECHSELIKKQRNQTGGSSLGGPLRYKNSVMLWLQCDKAVLNQRLDERVDEMIDRGLLNELLDFHKMYNEKRILEKTPSYTEGIFQSIGFKEFHRYLILSDEEKKTEKGKKLLEKAIEDMKVVTRQYARKQTKWVVNRFLRQPKRQLPPVFGLDATNVSDWNENVLQPAVAILQAFFEEKSPAINSLPILDPLDDVTETHYCEICERIFVGRRVWQIHLASKKHSKMKSSLKKQENNLQVKCTA